MVPIMSRKLEFICKYCKKSVKKTVDFAAGEVAKKKHEDKCKSNTKFRKN